jgi:L-lactate dehydrogenase complex protein LldG
MAVIDTSAARREILNSIRTNLQASGAIGHHDYLVATTSESRAATNEATVEHFIENLRAVGGKVEVVADLNSAASVLKNILESLRPGRIAISDSPKVKALIEQIVLDAEITEKTPAAELFHCDVGITTAQLAIAETGTLVLRLEAEFSRLTSLVPEVHICVLEASNIRATMSEVLSEIQQDQDPVVTFITGPSRTSDIELTLAIGVHGPRELFVIVIEG